MTTPAATSRTGRGRFSSSIASNAILRSWGRDTNQAAHQLDELRLRCSNRHGICVPRDSGASKAASRLKPEAGEYQPRDRITSPGRPCVPSGTWPVAKRSPILGYNHNVRYRGLVFHVQTEDSGLLNPHLFTHLFHEGVIVSTRKLVYDAGSNEEAIKSLMQAQHKAVMKDLKQGVLRRQDRRYLGGTPGLVPRGERRDAATSAPRLTAEPVARRPLRSARPIADRSRSSRPSRARSSSPVKQTRAERVDRANARRATRADAAPIPPRASRAVERADVATPRSARRADRRTASTRSPARRRSGAERRRATPARRSRRADAAARRVRLPTRLRRP